MVVYALEMKLRNYYTIGGVFEDKMNAIEAAIDTGFIDEDETHCNATFNAAYKAFMISRHEVK